MRLTLRIFVALACFAIGLAIDYAACAIYPPLPELQGIESVDGLTLVEGCNRDEYVALHPIFEHTQLAYPGLWVRDIPPTYTNQNWLGFYKTENGYEIRKAKIRITEVTLKLVNGYETELGRRFEVIGKSQPEFLLKGVPAVKEGKAITIFADTKKDMESKTAEYLSTCERRAFKMGGREYSIFAERFEIENGICFNPDAFIFDGEIKQRLSLTDNLKDSPAPGITEIVWVGDLDGDEKPDLIVESGYDPGRLRPYNGHTLFLSSFAREGELVAPVAKF
jgi:hypothetical protein